MADDNIPKITANAMQHIAKLIKTEPVTECWKNRKFLVRPFINAYEVIDLASSIRQMCTNEESGEMYPEMEDFAFKVNVISAYTTIELPEDINECYRIIYLTDLYETVSRNINNEQLKSIKIK